MDRTTKFSVGDLLVRFGKILRISEINSDTIQMRPFFQMKMNNGLTYLINNKNLYKDNIRKLVSKETLKQLFNKVFLTNTETAEINVVESRSVLSEQGLEESLQLIKMLWLEKKSHTGNLPGGKLTLYQQAVDQASEEIAAVKGILPQQAKLLLLAALKKNSNE